MIPRLPTPRPIAWDPQPGKPLPMPVLADDRESFPVEVVKQVLEWLASLKPQFDATPKPTDQIIKIGQTIDGRKKVTPTKIRVMYQAGQSLTLQSHDFSAGTVEMLLRDRKGAPIEATYHYLAARAADGRCIVGPYLRHQQKQAIILAS